MAQKPRRPPTRADLARDRFMSFLTELVSDLPVAIRPETLKELACQCQSAVRSAFARPNRLRPSEMKREMAAFAKGAERASKALDKMGEDGLVSIFASSGAERQPDDVNLLSHTEYLRNMARWAREAEDLYDSLTRGTKDNLGGRAPDKRLSSVIVVLMKLFQDFLALRPKHTIDPLTGIGKSKFDLFLRTALEAFHPEGTVFEQRRIDGVVTRNLGSRDTTSFAPPRFGLGIKRIDRTESE